MSYSGEGVSIYGIDGSGNPIPIGVTGGTATTGGSFATAPPSATRSDTYTVPASGVTVTAPAPLQSFSIVVRGTGATATAWSVVLEGSLDNVSFTTILTHSQATGNGVTLSSGTTLTPSLYFRSRLVSITLAPATAIVVTILGMA